jgi:5S rRNA maturation endonuclease (ribonuclease M5)
MLRRGILPEYKGAKLRWCWDYIDKQYNYLGTVARYDCLDGKKQIIPYFNINDGRLNVGSLPKPRPLYGQEKLANSNPDFVLITEGEKCTAALQSLGFIAVTSIGGSKQVEHADWSAIKGFKEVIIIPDNDEPGAEYAKSVCGILSKLEPALKINILNIPNLPKKGDIVDWLQPRIPDWDGYSPIDSNIYLNVRDELLELIETKSEPISKEWLEMSLEWPNPIDLESITNIPWPEDALPIVLNDFINSVAESTETPKDMAGMLVLAILGTACANRYVVELSPEHTEPLCIWTCCALPPGSRKTSVLNLVRKPLDEWECEQVVKLKEQKQIIESRIKTQEERIKSLRKRAVNAKKEDYMQHQAEIVELEKSMPESIVYPKLWTEDVTPERLASLLLENNQSLGLLSDEGGIFEIMSGRYSSGVPNIDIFLKGHACSPVRVARQSRECIDLHQPCISFGLTPQPDVIRGLADKPGFRGRGLLARFLYCLPLSNLGFRKLITVPIAENIKASYKDVLWTILNRAYSKDNKGNITPRKLILEDEALKSFKRFALEIESLMADGGRLEVVRDWAGKLPGAVARIAALSHVAHHAYHKNKPEECPIIQSTMEYAIEIGRYLITHALKAFDLIGSDPAFDGARYILKWIKRKKLTKFTQRDCHYENKSKFKRVRDLSQPFEVLTERFFIKELQNERVSHRPSKVFEVNPKILNITPQK